VIKRKLVENPFPDPPPDTYELDYNVTWKYCKKPGCIIKCVYACPGSDSDGQWMCCTQCGARRMFCSAHRAHEQHANGYDPNSDEEEEDDEEDDEEQ